MNGYRGVTVLFVLAAAALPAAGQTNTVFNFLRNDVGARAAALAGSFVSVTNDPSTLFYNAGALPTLEAPRGTAGFLKHLLDINSGYVVYSQSVPEIGTLAAGVIYTNYGSFDETDELGNTVGTFTAADIAVTAGYGDLIDEDLYAGGAIKFIHSSIAGYRSSALAVDAGILYVIPQSRLSLGASIRNLGAQLSTYAGVRESLPLDVTIGGSIVPRGLPLLLNVNFHKLNENPGGFVDRFRAFTVGGEFTLSRVFLLRFGYDNEERKDLKTGTTAGLAGFSAGIGIMISDYQVDYAISSLGTIGSLHRISVSSRF
ncbi:MAG: type IX secretion system protein PorQ [Bacteroidota bacterium]